MKQQADFSIQDWKSNHFSRLVEGTPYASSEQMQVLQEVADLQSMFPAVEQGEMDNDFFIDLFDALANYFAANADGLTNMDAMGIANHCHQASRAIKGRSGD